MQIKIGQRIGAGSALQVAMIATVAGIGYVALSNAGASFASYRTMALENTQAALSQIDIMETRLKAKEFIQYGTPDLFQAVQAAIAETRRRLTAAESQLNDPAHRGILAQAIEGIEVYDRGFIRLGQMNEERDRALALMDEAAPRIEQRITDVIGIAGKNDSATATVLGGEARRSLLLSRYHAQKFEARHDKASVDRVSQELDTVTQKLGRIAEIMPMARADIDEIGGMLRRYREAFGQNARLAVEMDQLVRETLVPQGARIQKASAEIRAALNTAQDQLGAEATAAMQQAQWTALLIGVLSVVLAVVASILIGRSISRPVVGITDVMNRLAHGVTQAAAEAGHAATEVLGAAQGLSSNSEMLTHEVEEFLAGVKAA